MPQELSIVILGLSITSSWGNGHATTYRALIRGLAERGHQVLFLERDAPWYAEQRDLPRPPFGKTRLYASLEELQDRFSHAIAAADLVMVGSYVPEGVAVGEWVVKKATGITAFYDIDTPVTLAKLAQNDWEYLHPDLIPRYDLYLSFTGGPLLNWLESHYGAPLARPLYCSVDPRHYYPDSGEYAYDLGYMGTYSDDRQPVLQRLLMEPARRWRDGRFIVAGPQYPESIPWPDNVRRIDHLSPGEHRAFYNSQRFTLNVTRADMVQAGYSPSVRLFEAAACATPIISDFWKGLDTIFKIDREILVAGSPEEVLHYLRAWPEKARRRLGERARARVLADHSSTHRAAELEGYIELAARRRLRCCR